MNKTDMQNLIKELIEKITTKEVDSVSVLEDGPSMNWFAVELREPHLFLSREGEGLSALNHIVRKMIENKISGPEKPEDVQIMIDINGFQKKKVDSLRAVAHMMAERARYFKSNIEVDPMPAFERRIVHEFLSTAQDLKTESVGMGRTRRVVIKYIGAV